MNQEDAPAAKMSFADAKETFVRRKDEVETFFKFLSLVFDKKADLSFGSTDGNGFEFSRRIQKMLLADGYLLVYNLVEATMTNIVDAVHSEAIGIEKGFDGLRREIQFVVLMRLKGLNLSDVKNNDAPIGRSMVRLALDTTKEERKIFKGNVDARVIRDTAENYGFEFSTDKEQTRDGARLLQVKSWRNRLAHGSHSFEECGGSSSVDEIADICREAVIYLESVLSRVESYCKSKEFAASA